MRLDGAIKPPSLIRFLGRLIRDIGRKVFLILDRLRRPTVLPKSGRGWPGARPISTYSPCPRTPRS